MSGSGSAGGSGSTAGNPGGYREEFNRLKIKHEKLFRDSMDCEKRYRDLGLKWFSLPTASRSSFYVDWRAEQFRALFLEDNPLIVQRMKNIRNRRYGMRLRCRDQEWIEAKAQLSAAEQSYKFVKDTLLAAEFDLLWESGASQLVNTGTDGGLPTTAAFGQKFTEMKKWIENLPEVKAAVRKGLETQASAFTLITSNEERFADAAEHSRDGLEGIEFDNLADIGAQPAPPPPLTRPEHRPGAREFR